MEIDAHESVNGAESNPDIKIHRSMCAVLRDVLDKVTWILPAIESAQPGYKTGIQELCCISNQLERGRFIIQQCTDGSKLYLAITAEPTLQRCQKIRSSLSQSLCLIQTMVHSLLAAQIVEVIEYINDAQFSIDPSEEAAGKSIVELLRQSDSPEEVEFSTFQSVASKLSLTTPKSILIEKRAIKKQQEKVSGDKDSKKQGVLLYLEYLVKKYGKRTKANNNRNSVRPDPQSKKPHKKEDDCPGVISPPMEFLCPMSSELMLDPVIISSGQTYERDNIKKWFDQGNDICPKTKIKLDNFAVIPNNAMKMLIASWQREHSMKACQPAEVQPEKDKPVISQDKRVLGYSLSESQYSITSLKDISTPVIHDKIRDLPFQFDHSNTSISSDSSFISESSRVFKGTEGLSGTLYELFPWNCDFQNHGSFSKFNREMFSRFLFDLSQLESELRIKAVEEFKIVLKGDDQETIYSMVSNGFVEELIEFLKSCSERCDLGALRIGLQLFLAFFSKSRFQMPYLSEDAFDLFSSLLETDARHEVLLIINKLIEESAYASRITESGLALSMVQLLETEEDSECLDVILKFLCKIPTQYGDIASHVVTAEIISKIASLLSEDRLAKYCLKLMSTLSCMEDTLKLITEIDGCLASICEFLDIGDHQDQDHALVVLLSLCSGNFENCSLVMKEGVIPALVDISVNGSQEGKGNATKLLCLLRDLRNNELLNGSGSDSDSPTGSASENVVELNKEKAVIEEMPVAKRPTGFFARKIKFFSKNR